MMKKAFRNSSILILSIIILGCSYFYLKYQESNYDYLIDRSYRLRDEFPQFVEFEGEVEPTVPDREKNSKDHLGLDLNDNGIRDDIDIWINRMGVSANERMAMRQYARSMQNFQKKCQTNIFVPESKDILDLTQAKVCLSLISDYEREEKGYAVKILNLLILNTEIRKTCHTNDRDKSLVKIVSIDILKHNCKFEVHDPKSIVEVSEIKSKR